MAYTRRKALTMAGGALLAPARPQFEISASLYAWDLNDEGMSAILYNLQTMSAVNSVYLVGLMHKARLPFTGAVFPHNPVRQSWEAEDASAYWFPDAKRYGRLTPRLSRFDWLNKTDWLTQMIGPARRRSLRVGVEISHTVLDGERAMSKFTDCMQRDINGKPIVLWDGVAYPVCVNNPDVLEYVLAIVSDFAANYDVDYIQTCMIPFAPGGPDKGGCFCAACARAARERGFDLERMQRTLLASPGNKEETSRWQAFRYDSVTRFYAALHDSLRSIRKNCELRFNSFIYETDAWGADLRAMRPHLDSVRVMEYSEQKGNAAAMEFKRRWLNGVRTALGKDCPLLSAIAVRPKATPELIEQGVRIAVECGVDGITLGHYEGAEYPMLRAIRSGLKAVNAGPYR